MGIAVADFGLSLREAWSMTVPDFWTIWRARHRKPKGSAAAKQGAPKFTPDDIRQLHELMAAEGAVQWRTV